LLRHTGTYVFDFATQDKLYEDLKALDLQKQNEQAVTPVAAPQTEALSTVATEVPETAPAPRVRSLGKSRAKTKVAA
jgi:hypothetical protein